MIVYPPLGGACDEWIIDWAADPWRHRYGWRGWLRRSPPWIRRVWWSLGLPGWSPSRAMSDVGHECVEALRAGLRGLS